MNRKHRNPYERTFRKSHTKAIAEGFKNKSIRDNAKSIVATAMKAGWIRPAS